MKKTIGLAIVGLIFPGTVLAQSATFEAEGLPLTLHQAQVIAFPDAEEQAAAPIVLDYNGFPASPMQMLVLAPHRDVQLVDTVDREQGEAKRQLLVPVSAHGR